MIKRSLTRAVWALAALLLLALLVDAAWLWQLQGWNRQIAEGRPDASSARPELRFARAHALAASAAHGAASAAQVADEATLNHYRALQGDEGALGQAARYNGANLLLRQALALRESAQPGQAIALLELAKEGYRELLRLNPQHWDARYNLARAQRLQPDPVEEDLEPMAEPRAAERAATTMRAQTLGLP
ncbi:MxaK protein [Rubrivivax sp. A210]|uniref:MxaK protein n=1 Tax=Rubrivivax sp. A210 TaxID=2772301 RepID=UPI001918C0EF|nr:MxaK protein [Rubrivivax sp. A210]CAD5372132.1 MxaK protein [Rubrivivax sp. A210]